nr:phosphate-starvation-inducible protein PsiE [Indiicoccus explosivorum]
MVKRHFGAVAAGLPLILQLLLNLSLVFLAAILAVLLIRELIGLSGIVLTEEAGDYKAFLESILVFFLYFEFISMIVKYFKENYHFPLRYFIYIGITAMIRLIIVEHHDPIATFYYSLVILILVIGYFILNVAPRVRPDSRRQFLKPAPFEGRVYREDAE